MDKPMIHELRITCPDGGTLFVYCAMIGGKLVNLAPYGNRIPEGLGG